MDFDLPAIDTKARSEKGVAMQVKTLSGAPLLNSKRDGVFLTLLGPDSDTYRALYRSQVRKSVELRAAGKEPDAAEEEKGLIDFLVALTTGWEGMLDKAGEPIPFSAEAARELYTRFPVIRDQADTFSASRANFTSG